MKIVITEGGHSTNVGSMALIENAIRIARTANPDVSISVFCSDAQGVDSFLKHDGEDKNVSVFPDLFCIPSGGNVIKFFWLLQCVLWIVYSRLLLLFTKKISWAFGGRRKRNLKEVEDADFIYCIGAERINDIYYKTAMLSLYAIGTYIKMGKKLVHMSLTIGPVFYNSTISLAKKILNKSYAIFVRDQKSYDILNEWNCKAPYQFNSYDIALLQKTDIKKSQELLAEFGVKSGFIGLSCIYWRFRKAKGPVRQVEYERAQAEALDYIIEKYNKQIVVTPTVVTGNYLDDSGIGKRIAKQMKHGDKVICISRLLSPVELASLFSQCCFSIVTRMHAAILCSGAGGRPIIAINYLYKLREYMKNIGFEDYSVDIDYVQSKDLISFVDNMMSNLDENVSKLHNRQSYLRDHIKENISQINNRYNG